MLGNPGAAVSAAIPLTGGCPGVTIDPENRKRRQLLMRAFHGSVNGIKCLLPAASG